MSKLKRRITFGILIACGIVCVTLSFIFPEVIPILVPVAGALFSGAFGMFQSVIPATNDDNESTQTQYEDAHSTLEEESHDDVHIDHNVNVTDNSVQILFMCKKNGNFQDIQHEEEILSPDAIDRPKAPLHLV